MSTAITKALALLGNNVNIECCEGEEADRAGEFSRVTVRLAGLLEMPRYCLPEGIIRESLDTLSRGMRGGVKSPRYDVCAGEETGTEPLC